MNENPNHFETEADKDEVHDLDSKLSAGASSRGS